MQAAMTLESLLTEVQRQSSPEVKRDFVTSTKDNVQIVPSLTDKGVDLILLRDGNAQLEKFSISENAHRQISSRLQVPWKFYSRLLADHRDMVVDTVNKLFEREPANRMIRVLDGEVRAFLSNRYLRLDNQEVLENTLPAIVKGDLETTLLASNVNEHNMHLKVLFTGDELAHEVARANGKPRIIRPAFRLSNSETGGGALKMEAFFYDSYCTNGCVWGTDHLFDFKRTHLGGIIAAEAELEIFSDETRKLEDKVIISQVNDAMHAISNPENVKKMADELRAAAQTDSVNNPVKAVELVVKELDLRESEQDSILETFMRDQDYSKFGLAAAVTEVANDAEQCSFERTVEIENVGAQILSMNLRQWNRVVTAEKVLAA